MKKNIVIFILLVLDLVMYFSIDNGSFENEILLYVKIALLVFIIPLLYFVISNLIKEFQLKFNDLLEFNRSERSSIDLRIESLINENEKIRLENNKIIEDMKSNQDELCNSISELQKQVLQGFNNFQTEIKNENNKLSEDVNDLINVEEKFLSTFNSHIIKVHEGYENLEKLFGSKYQDLNNIISSNIEKLTEIQIDNNKLINENIGGLGELVDDSIKVFKENIEEAIEESNSGVARNVNKVLRDIKNNNELLNNQWKDLNKEMHLDNNNIIIEINNTVSKIVALHNDMLMKMDENQNKLMELNKEDINLMKELIR